MNSKNPKKDERKAAVARERLRRRYLPDRVCILFVGEGPPASGRFFYQEDSGLYRAIRDAFLLACPTARKSAFLQEFRERGCYLVDLCGKPVDDLGDAARRRACVDGEARLAGLLRRLGPEVVVTVLRSIAPNVERGLRGANWQGRHIVLPYPGRWKLHRMAFIRGLVPVLRKRCP